MRNQTALIAAILYCLPHSLCAQTASNWSPIGTPTTAARISAVITDPRSSFSVIIASPGGGIWRSDDGGINWNSLSDNATTLRICSLASDPASPDILYAGTGDSSDPTPDQGVLRSLDGGRSWTASLPFTDSPLCSLAIDPTESRRIAAASAEGLFVSVDSGATWKRSLAGVFTAVAFDTRGKLIAARQATSDLGARAGILTTSSDGGITFADIMLPETAASPASRTTGVSLLARGSEVYVAVAYIPSGATVSTVDVYSSFDSGGTWTVAASVGSASPPLQLASDRGGVRLFLATGSTLLNSANRGQTWAQVGTQLTNHHSAAATTSVLWLGGELGLEYRPLDSAFLAMPVPNPPVQQFVDVAATSISDILAAGSSGLARQDGTNPLWKTVLTTPALSAVVAGNLNSTQQRTILANSSTKLFRSTDNGASIAAITAMPEAEARAPLPPLLADPGTLANIFLAGQQLYRSTDQGASFQSFATIDPDRSHVVTALAAAPSTRRFMYAATACIPQLAGPAGCAAVSYIWRSTNSGQSWVQATPVTGWVYQLAVDPRQTATVYAAIGAQPFAGTANSSLGDVVRSTDSAASWTSLRTNLPRGNYRTIGIDSTVAPTGNLPFQNLFAGGEKGVFLTNNGGTQWVALNAGLPRDTVAILRQAGSDGLIAGTLGRGAFNARISGLATSLIASPLELIASLPPGGAANLSVSLSNVLSATVQWSATLISTAAGNWIHIPVSGGLLDARGSTSVALAIDASALTAGTYTALLQITSGALGGTSVSQVIPVSVYLEETRYSLTAISPVAPSAAIGTSLPPLTVSLRDENDQPVAGELISFAISGGGVLSRRSALTLSDGTASVILTLPTVPGSTFVTASYRNQAVRFTAQALQLTRPSLQANSVVSAATFNSGASLAPGQIVSIFGQNLASAERNATALPLPTTLLSTRALLAVNGVDTPLPLFYVSPSQVNAVLPLDVAPGTYNFTVEVDGQRGNDIQLNVAAFAPGIFTVDSTGRGPGIFLKGNGTLISAANAAIRGSVISFYAVGLGAVNPVLNAGEPGRLNDPLNRTTTQPRVFFDNLEGVVSYSGMAPGYAGLYQINVQIPSGLSPASNIPVSLSIGGAASNRVTIAVQ